MGQKRYPNTAARRKTVSGVGAANRLGSRTPLLPAFNTPVGTATTVTFDTPYIWNGELPLWTSDDNPVASVTPLTPTTAKVVFLGTPSGDVVVGFEDPSFRNMAGGYVPNCTYAFPA